ncbi:hypothetical protein IW262DRAFT_1265648, partial [Armillaria fumosa]
ITSLWLPVPAKPYDPTDPKMNPLNPQGLKPCSARDDCFLKYGTTDGDEKCQELVRNHLACMRGLGFKL